jgi:hypothetical protein
MLSPSRFASIYCEAVTAEAISFIKALQAAKLLPANFDPANFVQLTIGRKGRCANCEAVYIEVEGPPTETEDLVIRPCISLDP